jgi:hypothetical protein
MVSGDTMNPKDIGDISQAMVLAALVKAGKRVLLPFGDNRRYDLVIEGEDGSFVKIQVKTGRIRPNGTIHFRTASTYSHRGGKQRHYQGEVDLFAVYVPKTGKVYLVPVDAVGVSECYLHVGEPRNGQIKGVRRAEEYEFP